MCRIKVLTSPIPLNCQPLSRAIIRKLALIRPQRGGIFPVLPNHAFIPPLFTSDRLTLVDGDGILEAAGVGLQDDVEEEFLFGDHGR